MLYNTALYQHNTEQFVPYHGRSYMKWSHIVPNSDIPCRIKPYCINLLFMIWSKTPKWLVAIKLSLITKMVTTYQSTKMTKRHQNERPQITPTTNFIRLWFFMYKCISWIPSLWLVLKVKNNTKWKTNNKMLEYDIFYEHVDFIDSYWE